jgi:hypothetical protein
VEEIIYGLDIIDCKLIPLSLLLLWLVLVADLLGGLFDLNCYGLRLFLLYVLFFWFIVVVTY